MKELRSWEGWIIGKQDWKVLHRDGRSMSQVQAAVRAPSMAAAARALSDASDSRITVPHIKNFMSETGNQECLEALDCHPPLTVILKSIDPGGTVMGEQGWVACFGTARKGGEKMKEDEMDGWAEAMVEPVEVIEFKVWWIPQIPGKAFEVPVPDLASGIMICNALAAYDLFQYENRIKPDYANAGGIAYRHPTMTEGEWEDVDLDDQDEVHAVQVASAPGPWR